MSVKLPTIGPDAPAEKPVENKPVENTTAENKAAENKFDRFRPEMPQIPGVGQNARRGPTGLDSQRLLLIGGVVAAVVLIGAILLWRARSKPDARANPISNAESAEPLAPVPALPNPAAPAFDGTTVLPQLSDQKAHIKLADTFPGFKEGIQMMNVGAQALFVLPPALSFGAGKWPPGVVRGTPLIFQVTLENVVSGDKSR